MLNLFYAVGCLVGFDPASLQNVCGDPDWAAIQQVRAEVFALPSCAFWLDAFG